MSNTSINFDVTTARGAQVSSEVLQYILNTGRIDITSMQEEMEMKKRQELIEHFSEITNHHIMEPKSDKYWRVKIPDESKSSGNRMVKKSTKEAVENEIVKYMKERIEDPTIESIFEEWNDYDLSLGNISKATYTRNKQTYKRHYQEFGKRHIKSVESIEMTTFLEKQVPECELSKSQFSKLKTLTKNILIYAKRKHLVKFDIEEMFLDVRITDKAFKKKQKKDCEEVFTADEFKQVIKYLSENRDIHNMGLLLICLTGMRIGEMVVLKNEDINIERQTVNVSKTETRYMEDGKQVYEVKDTPKTENGIRTIPVPTEYIWLIKAVRSLNPFNAYGGYIFVKEGKRMHTECFRKRFYRICKKLGISGRSPHALRKTYATIFHDNKVNEAVMISLMGHAKFSTTEQFYLKDNKTMEEKRNYVNEVFANLM